MKGIFYGVSVGPGDPDFLTLRALNIIEKTRILFAPATKKSEDEELVSQALNIVSQRISLEQKELHLVQFPMGKDSSKNALVYEQIVQEISEILNAGESVAFLCLGDVTIYATSFVVEEKLHKAGYKTEVIPGVSSFCAGAASLHIPVVMHNQALTVIPGDAAFKDGSLPNLLDIPGTKVIMKSSKSLPKIMEEIKKHKHSYVSMAINVGMKNADGTLSQRIIENALECVEKEPELMDGNKYFSIIYVG